MDSMRVFFGKLQSRLGVQRVEKEFADPAVLRSRKGQSFIELALILPLLLLMVLGIIEAALFMGRYLDMLDLTREAARFASYRDPLAKPTGNRDCNDKKYFDFYFNTACIFSPPQDEAATCPTPEWCPIDPLTGDHGKCFCSGLNRYVDFNSETDDIVISVYTVTNTGSADDGTLKNEVTNVMPDYATQDKGYWALSNPDNIGSVDDENWKKDCRGNVDLTKEPHFTKEVVNSVLDTSPPPSKGFSKGFVAVEFYYCYKQLLGILPNLSPFNDVFPNPMRLNAYSLMPLPEAAPTPTPMPVVP
jgi:hypothetical protein